MDYVIIRPPMVYGPNAPGNFKRLVNLIKYGFPLPISNIKNKRSFVGIDNLIDFIDVCISAKNASNEIFLVSDNQDVSTFELTFNDLTNTTYYKTILARGTSRDGSQWVFWDLAGYYRYNSNAVTGLKLYTGSGSNFTSGNYQLYGIK